TSCSRDWSSDVCSSDLFLQNAPFKHDVGFMGNGQSLLHIMIGNQDSDIFIYQTAYNFLNIFNGNRIYSGKRFIQKNKIRACCKTPCNFSSSSFATGKQVAPVFPDMLE